MKTFDERRNEVGEGEKRVWWSGRSGKTFPHGIHRSSRKGHKSRAKSPLYVSSTETIRASLSPILRTLDLEKNFVVLSQPCPKRVGGGSVSSRQREWIKTQMTQIEAGRQENWLDTCDSAGSGYHLSPQVLSLRKLGFAAEPSRDSTCSCWSSTRSEVWAVTERLVPLGHLPGSFGAYDSWFWGLWVQAPCCVWRLLSILKNKQPLENHNWFLHQIPKFLWR